MSPYPDDEEIARHLRRAQESGELKAAPSWGRPMPAIDGWDDTPAPLRLPMKILRDAGLAPPEIGWMRRRAQIRAQLQMRSLPDAHRQALQRELADLQQKIALRLESLRVHERL